jgi:hypothetical protein
VCEFGERENTELSVGFRGWLLRVIDHEAVLMDPKLFSSWVHRQASVVLLKRGFERQTSSRWRFSRKNDWIVQVILQHVIKAIRVLSTRKIENGDPAAEAGMGDGTFSHDIRSLRRCVVER